MEQFLLEQLDGDPQAGKEVVDLCLDHALVRDEHPDKFTRIEGLAWFPDLEVLSISMQALPSMAGLGHLPSLRSLNLSLNQISRIEGLENLPSLAQLDLSHNALETLDGLFLDQNPAAIGLRELNLGHNHLSGMSFPAPLPKLETLILSGNRRIKAVEGLASLPALRSLYLKGCYIAEWAGLGEAKNLETLSITPGSMEKLSVLGELTELHNLWIAGGRLQGAATLPKMPQLRQLHLSGGMGLHQLHGIEHLPKLETLVLRQNRIETPPDLTANPLLRHLDLSYNPLSSLPDLSSMPGLETVILEGSPIHPKAILEVQEAMPGVEFRY